MQPIEKLDIKHYLRPRFMETKGKEVGIPDVIDAILDKLDELVERVNELSGEETK